MSTYENCKEMLNEYKVPLNDKKDWAHAKNKWLDKLIETNKEVKTAYDNAISVHNVDKIITTFYEAKEIPNTLKLKCLVYGCLAYIERKMNIPTDDDADTCKFYEIGKKYYSIALGVEYKPNLEPNKYPIIASLISNKQSKCPKDDDYCAVYLIIASDETDASDHLTEYAANMLMFGYTQKWVDLYPLPDTKDDVKCACKKFK